MEKIKEECKVTLRPLQIKAIEHISNEDNLFAVLPTGSGKTLIAIAAAQIFLKESELHNIIVISPTAVLYNFHKEIKKYNKDLTLDRYRFYSFRKLPNIVDLDDVQELLPNSMVIIDEAHNIRNTKTQAGIAAVRFVEKCKKILLMTATPFVNYLGDFKIYIKLLYKNDNFDKSISQKPERGSSRYHKDLETIKKFLKNRVCFEEKKPSEDYPKYTEHDTKVFMDNSYYRKYLISLKKVGVFGDSPEVFYHGYRRVVNDAGIDEYYSAKVLEFHKLYRNEQTLLFTNWLDFGIAIIKDLLDEKEITYDIIDGSVTAKRRQQIVEEYNHKVFKILLITRAGYEGLDLKGTRDVFVLDPVWHLTGYYQIIGRAIRYKSHEHLPDSKRNVNIYKMILVPPNDDDEVLKIDMEILGIPFHGKSGDEILYHIMENKRLIHNDVTEMLKKCCIK
jgi:SNF2 family DNA or RNA helicase